MKRMGILRCLPAVALLFATGVARAEFKPAGDWRLVQAQPAPWAQAAVAIERAWIGRTLRFEAAASDGPGVLACAHATFTPWQAPFEGLFQGGLPAPAEAAAKALGFSAAPVDSLRMDCDSGSFEFHAADADTLLFALDNVIWTIARSAGTAAPAGSPEAAAQVLLERHFAGDMGFSAEAWADKRELLGRGLDAAIGAYFARPGNPDEVPPVDGDPLTDSQEYPQRFRVDAARIEGDCAAVPVQYADAWRRTTVTLRLCRTGAAWRLDDVLYARGGRFSDLLQDTPAP